MNCSEVFIAAVENSQDDVPSDLRKNAGKARAVEEHAFDITYIEFLDDQIRLNARGEEWTTRLRRRREALAPFVNTNLIRGAVRSSNADYTVEVDPVGKRIIHWEQYEL